MANVVSGTFAAAGAGATFQTLGPGQGFNVRLHGTFVGTVRLERCFPGEAVWEPFTYIDGTVLAWTGPVNTTLDEPEAGTSYRLNCTALTGGAVAWRLSQ